MLSQSVTIYTDHGRGFRITVNLFTGDHKLVRWQEINT